MRTLACNLWLLLGMFVSFGAYANCPPGSYLISNPTNTYCLPDPNYRSPQQALQQPVEQWERRWGAIATDGPRGAMGVVTDKRSEREASQIAMQDCRAKGGVDCKVDAAYDNQCAAVVVGDGGYNVSSRPTADQAITTGMKTCRDAGRSNCHVYYSACSLPVRIR
ncbi:DUF4189 domain-containing protein [Variovorax sp. ZT4R33]|uniref:DUF4189 domain-containing protein n=1 Tax=Variovorax sp. ZT4R33 TaxID=3443743 RepID=UPI003F48FD41